MNPILVWSNYFKEKKNKITFVLTLLVFICISLYFKIFLTYVESWDHSLGVFNDPFFIIQPIDFSLYIFILTYGSLLFFFILNLLNPDKLLKLFHLVSILLILRSVTLFLFRLDADPNMITLSDPILNNIFYQLNENTGMYNQHDLFFSGHIGNLFIISSLYDDRKTKYFFFIITFIVAVLLVVQRAHYSIDVIFAPIFSLIAIYIYNKFKNII
tara:strand:- start:41417 stop:42058 length:642 start_codon:yes stop_codon:yes gene_type:complete